jgi:NAD(P)-dependent dehydrogenase (short-subunit alcohol dehydrogenase family)
MDDILSKKRAVLVTGCSSGIGLGTARVLRSHGYRVFATARREEHLVSLTQEGFEALHLDLRDSLSIKSLAQEVLDKTEGRLYGLFNNSGYGQPGAVEDLTRDALREQIEVNLLGTHELTSAVIPAMRKAGEGRIIVCSSVLGLVALKFRGAYCASKFALEGLFDALRIELRGSGVHVSLIEPGPIESRFRANAFLKFKEYVQVSGSVHQASYEQMITRLEKPDIASRFTLPAEAVAVKVLAALESNPPKSRYYVTFPTYLLGYARRFLPTSALDWLLLKAGV